jgi:integrase
MVTLGGRDFYCGPHGTKASRAEYDRLVGEWLANGRRLTPSNAGDVTIIDLIDAYRQHCESYYGAADGQSAGELSGIRLAMKQVRVLYGHTLAIDFGPLALKTVRQSMVGLGWARKYVNAQVGRIRRLFKWAVAQELVSATILEGLRAVDGLRAGKSEAKETDPVRPVPEPIIEATRSHLSPTVRDMVDLQLLTGMRPGELLAMRGRDLDTTAQVWVYKPEEHKNAHRGHERLVYLGERSKAIVKRHLKPDLGAFLFSPMDADRERRDAAAEARKTPLSCGNRSGSNRVKKPKRSPGDRYDVDAYRRAIARACDRAFELPSELCEPRTPKQRAAATAGGMMTAGKIAERMKARKEWRAEHTWFPYQLRHNAGTRFRRDHGLEVAQVMLGQKSLTVTQVYAEKNVAAAVKVVSEGG